MGRARRPTRGLGRSSGMRPRPLLWNPALREVCAAPPSVRRSHAPCQEGATPLSLEATPCREKLLLPAWRGSAPLRRLLGRR